jgi:hypothetical protein
MISAELFADSLIAALISPDGEIADLSFNTYWLLDQSALPAPPWLDAYLEQVAYMGVLQSEVRPALDGASPLLVTCDAASARSHRFAKQVYAVARFANGVSVLRSSMPLAMLQQALRTRLHVELVGNVSALLRVFDTRTLPALPEILTAEQYKAFMFGMEAWWFLDRRGTMRRMPSPTADAPLASGPLKLDEAQEQALVNDGLTDAVIDMMISQRHPALLDLTPPEQFECMQPLVVRAQQMGFRDPPQALAFVAKAMEEGADFHQREPWAGALARFAAGTCQWSEALA